MIKEIQTLLNVWGIKGLDNKALTVDGYRGRNTEYAMSKAKILLRLIMKAEG